MLVDTMFYAALTPLLPHYADTLGLTKTGAGILTAAFGIGTLVGSLPAGMLAARAGVKPVVLVGLGLLAASSPGTSSTSSTSPRSAIPTRTRRS